MTEIQLEMPDQKRKPYCRLRIAFTLSDNTTVRPLSYERARHLGVAHYDKQRLKRKLPLIAHPRDFEGWSGPPSWIGERFGQYVWDYERREYVLAVSDGG